MDEPETEVERLPSSHARLVTAVLLVVLAVAAGPGIAAHFAAPATTPPPVQAELVAPSSSIAVTSPNAAPANTPKPSPRHIDANTVACGRVKGASCAAIVAATASLFAVGLPPVSRVTVYPSLLCDSSLDCPPDVLSHSLPLGSAVVSFADDGPEAWVNVIDVHDSASHHAEAWIERWVAPLPTPRPSATSGQF